jgi:hypothetical protein
MNGFIYFLITILIQSFFCEKIAKQGLNNYENNIILPNLDSDLREVKNLLK